MTPLNPQMRVIIVLAAAAIACAPRLAWSWPAPQFPDEPMPPPPADPPPPITPSAAPVPAAEQVEPPPSPAELAERIEELERRQTELEGEAARNDSTREQVKALIPLGRFITVFIDVGAFAVAGDGSGIRSDLGHYHFPQYAGHVPAEWTFMGDPLATTINSLGEPADISNSRAIHTDTIHSKGHPSVLVNSIGLSIAKRVTESISISALAELLPRPGPDILDVELAQIHWRPSHTVNFEISAGKIDSVLGVEYRSQDAPKRTGITPSLICRYTCGRPLGVQARLERGRLIASASLTNGDNFDERFEPHLQLKLNNLPTFAGHLQWVFPLGQGLEVGVSGAIGPQDNQPDPGIAQWHVGLDIQLRDLHDFDVAAELVQGSQDGSPMSGITCGGAPCLTYKGGYALVAHRVNSWLTPYVRVDFRNAIHLKGADFVYESHTLRSTVGARFAMTSRVLAKIEYTINREINGVPEFNDDVLTSSLVVATD
ncbi:MAG: uncharacterized protein JWO36_5647 [Myxococcales bacterium]|nr:uncharacterized protein [Myxococcales bacterium]